MGRKKPKVGGVYDAYFDGKCSPSRLYRVEVDKVIRRDDMTRKMQRAWRAALREDFSSVFDGIVLYVKDSGECSRQFWDWNCDEFIVGHIVTESSRPILFAKAMNGFEWYGVDGNYALDIQGEVRKKRLKDWEKAAYEIGTRLSWSSALQQFVHYDKESGEEKEL